MSRQERTQGSGEAGMGSLVESDERRKESLQASRSWRTQAVCSSKNSVGGAFGVWQQGLLNMPQVQFFQIQWCCPPCKTVQLLRDKGLSRRDLWQWKLCFKLCV